MWFAKNGRDHGERKVSTHSTGAPVAAHCRHRTGTDSRLAPDQACDAGSHSGRRGGSARRRQAQAIESFRHLLSVLREKDEARQANGALEMVNFELALARDGLELRVADAR